MCTNSSIEHGNTQGNKDGYQSQVSEGNIGIRGGMIFKPARNNNASDLVLIEIVV